MTGAVGRVSIVETGGRVHQVPISVDIYKNAAEARLSVPDYLQMQYGQHADKNYANGNIFAQMMASINSPIDVQGRGFQKMVLGDVLSGKFQAATTEDAQSASSILAPAAILSLVEENPQDDHSETITMFDRLIAIDSSIPNKRFEMPIFDSSNADLQQTSAIGQLATPNIVGQLKVSEKAYAIPTISYGVEISDEALTAYTIDHVALYLRRLRNQLTYNLICQQFNSIINGDLDMDMKPLEVKPISMFDSAAGNGKITHRGYVKWLRSGCKYRRPDYVLCNEDDYFEIIERKGRPTVLTNPVVNSEQMAYNAKPVNMSLQEPNIFILEEGIVPAGTLVAVDSKAAIARVRNSKANYDATLDLVMQKGKQMRFDEGQVVYRHDDQAFIATTIH